MKIAPILTALALVTAPVSATTTFVDDELTTSDQFLFAMFASDWIFGLGMENSFVQAPSTPPAPEIYSTESAPIFSALLVAQKPTAPLQQNTFGQNGTNPVPAVPEPSSLLGILLLTLFGLSSRRR